MNNTIVENKIVDIAMAVSEEELTLYFSRSQKLLTAEHYTNVFSKSQRFGNKSFTLLARENNLGYPRLGLAISKKSVKHAVDRNSIKRIIRENFRLHQHEIPSIDIIAMCKPNVLSLEKYEIHKQMETQWHFMRKKFVTSTSTD